MNPTYAFYGWHASYFAGKVRTYLLYKQVPLSQPRLTLWTLLGPVKRHTGAAAMPAVLTPEGRWLSDSSEIIDHFEAAFPQRPVLPPGPLQRCVSYLLEAWLDEWWIPMAMHSRWSYPENYQTLFRRDVGDQLMPGFARPIKNLAVDYVARMLRGMCPAVGIRAEQLHWLDRWSEDALDLLQAHLQRHPYLLGGRPSLADFALAGPLYGHLGRDPWPARVWIAPRPALRQWTDRMASPPPGADAGELWADDQIPATLEPLLRLVLTEFSPYVEGILAQVQTLAPTWPPGKTLPRALADVCVDTPQGRFCRQALPYTLWMVQRLQDVFAGLDAPGQRRVRQAFTLWGSARLLDLAVPRLERRALRVALAG